MGVDVVERLSIACKEGLFALLTSCKVDFSKLMNVQNEVGRPQVDLDEEDIEEMRAMDYPWEYIAELFECSLKTLQRWRNRVNFADSGRALTEEELSDEDLDTLIRGYVAGNPNIGEKRVLGYLKSIERKVTRQRVRDSVLRVDPEGKIQRRTDFARRIRGDFHIDRAGFMVSIDGHEKLPFRLFVYGAVDVSTRRVLYLRLSDSKKASIILRQYRDLVRDMGDFVPICVRIDRGTEFTKLMRYQYCRRGFPVVEQDMEGEPPYYQEGHALSMPAVITGSSTKNCRVERMWRDYRETVVDPFRQLLSGSSCGEYSEREYG